MGERSQDWGERQVSVRLSLIQLHAAAVTPSPVDTLCASQTNGLSPCSAALFLSLRHAPPPLTHTHRLTHSPLHTHPHTPSHTPHSPSLTHTHPHILLTHLNTSLAHPSHTPQTHTLFTPTYTLTHTHPHTLTHTHSSYPHTHTPSHTPHLHTYTHIHTHTHTHTIPEPTGAKTQETRGPRGSAHTPGTWSVWEQLRVAAGVRHWTFHTLGATGTLEAP